LDLLNMAESSGNSSTSSSSGGGAEGGLSAAGTPNSPPKAEVDDSPLQKCMDKNKECECARIKMNGLRDGRQVISRASCLSGGNPFRHSFISVLALAKTVDCENDLRYGL